MATTSSRTCSSDAIASRAENSSRSNSSGVFTGSPRKSIRLSLVRARLARCRDQLPLGTNLVLLGLVGLDLGEAARGGDGLVAFAEGHQVPVVGLLVLQDRDLLEQAVQALGHLHGELAAVALEGPDLVDEVALRLGERLQRDAATGPAQQRLGDREGEVRGHLRGVPRGHDPEQARADRADDGGSSAEQAARSRRSPLPRPRRCRRRSRAGSRRSPCRRGPRPPPAEAMVLRRQRSRARSRAAR